MHETVKRRQFDWRGAKIDAYLVILYYLTKQNNLHRQKCSNILPVLFFPKIFFGEIEPVPENFSWQILDLVHTSLQAE